MKIWFDMDGVLSEFGPNAIRVANDLWPHRKVPRNYVPKDYDYTDLFSAAEWNAIWDEIKTTPDFWLRQGCFHANVSALRTWMHSTNHEIFFITSRKATGGVGSRPQTILWLNMYGLYPKDHRPTVIAVNNAKEKKKYIEEYKIDFGIDDLPSTVTEANMLSYHHCYLLDQPWNRDSNEARVESLQEFLDIVDNHSLR